MTGPELARERERGGVKARDVAEALGVNPTLISHWETSLRPVPEKMVEPYLAAVRRIALERAEAVGAIEPREEVAA